MGNRHLVPQTEPPATCAARRTGNSRGMAEAGRRFVVQRHRARGAHYDLRLELDGVLVSWAVPKGPTLDPARRRTAFRVGDHPLEYVDFEGVVPAGQYGAGDVVVWDAGTWRPREGDDPARALADGSLHVDLEGHKLHGRFVLVRRSAGGGADDREQWLLMHKRDTAAVEGWEPGDHPRSVLSGRTNDEVAEVPDRLWRSDLSAEKASIDLRPPLDGPGDDALKALDDLEDAGTWHVHGRDVRVTNLEKVLFPPREGGEPVTKRDLLRYAARIAPVLVPHLEGRALNMHRYPDGASRKGFWHKERPARAPGWLTGWRNPDAEPDETQCYVVVDEPAALVWVANFGALEWHPWTSRTDAPDRPTYALVDIDPGERTSWEEVLVLARLHRTAIDHLGLTAAAKVTGRRGIQIWVPIRRGPTFEQTRGWVERLSRTVAAVVPDLVSWEWQVRDRGGLARLDYTQNAVNKTLVAPYSPRPAPGAPVSVPIGWDELDDPALRPDGFTFADVHRRLAEHGDLFRPLLTADQVLPPLT
jgi:bifunctional non-homologous end joining protein LigD